MEGARVIVLIKITGCVKVAVLGSGFAYINKSRNAGLQGISVASHHSSSGKN